MLMDPDENVVFRALADPTRRALLSRLREREQPVAELTRHFEISQPAVSQHLKVLKEAGLVRERKAGRQRIYEVDEEPLRLAVMWLERHTGFWTSRLDNLAVHLRRKYGEESAL